MITRQSTCLSVCLSNSALAFIHFSSTLGHENPLFQALDTEHSMIDVCRVWCGASEKTWLCREIMSSYRFPLPVLNDCELNISAIFSSLTNFADCIRLFCPGDGVLADSFNTYAHTHIQYFLHTHTRLTALCPGLPGWSGTTKVKPIWILLKQQTVSGSGISWTICKSAPRSRQ